MKRTVFLALPTYTGKPEVETMYFILGAKSLLEAEGIKLIVEATVGNGLIHQVRNKLVASALGNPDVTDVVFLDDDVVAHPQDLWRLLKAPVDFVTGVYPAKKDPLQWFVQFEQIPVDQAWNAELELLEMSGVPAGFMRLTRGALEEMIAHYPELEYKDETMPKGKAWALFYPQLINGEDWGEDMVFCKRWRDMGKKLYVDPALKLRHVGRKVYEGCFGEWLMEQGRNRQVEAA